MISAQSGRIAPKSETYAKRDAKQAAEPRCIDCGTTPLTQLVDGMCRGCRRELER